MGILDKVFGKRRAAHEAALVDQERGQKLEGREVGQTAGEIAATRLRMESELDGQRERRANAPQRDA